MAMVYAFLWAIFLSQISSSAKFVTNSINYLVDKNIKIEGTKEKRENMKNVILSDSKGKLRFSSVEQVKLIHAL